MATTSDFLSLLGRTGTRILSKEVSKLSDNLDTPWKKDFTKVVADGIGRHGVDGFNLAMKRLGEGVNGNKAVDLSFIGDLELLSNTLAHFQEEELKERIARNQFLDELGQTVGKIMQGVLLGLVGMK
jgi:hypothetical protein